MNLMKLLEEIAGLEALPKPRGAQHHINSQYTGFHLSHMEGHSISYEPSDWCNCWRDFNLAVYVYREAISTRVPVPDPFSTPHPPTYQL